MCVCDDLVSELGGTLGAVKCSCSQTESRVSFSVNPTFLSLDKLLFTQHLKAIQMARWTQRCLVTHSENRKSDAFNQIAGNRIAHNESNTPSPHVSAGQPQGRHHMELTNPLADPRIVEKLAKWLLEKNPW